MRDQAATKLLPFIQYSKPDYQVAPHHVQITDALEAVERGDTKRLAIFVPPRHGKSEIASRRFPAWYAGRNPDKQIICASYSAELATDFGRDVRNIVADREFQNVFPNVTLSPDSAAANRWHTNHGGVYVATGIGGSLTGRGAHVALIDDPVKDQQDADSELIRDRTWDWYVSVLRTRLMPKAAIVLIQTRWHEDDLAGRVLERSGEHWEVISLPAIVDGRALWPEAYPLSELEAIRALDKRKFSALYQQQPQPDDGTFFLRDWVKWYREPPEFLNCYTTADFAVTEGGGDFTEIATHGVDPAGNLYLGLDWYTAQVTADVWIEQLLAQFRKRRPLAFFGETGVIRRVIEPILSRRMRETRTFCRLEWITRTHDKATTARALQARMAGGKVFLPDTDQGHRLLAQMLSFPAGMHDDAVDCAAMMALAIDQAHPAVVKQTVVKPKPDRWDIAFGNDHDEVASWKTA